MDLAELRKQDPNKYWLGPITKIHEIGEYAFVEYNDAEDGEQRYSIFVNGENTNNSTNSLDHAMVLAIAYKHDGCNTRADSYFMKMINND